MLHPALQVLQRVTLFHLDAVFETCSFRIPWYQAMRPGVRSHTEIKAEFSRCHTVALDGDTALYKNYRILSIHQGLSLANQINRSIEYCCAIPSLFSKCLNSLVLPYGLRWESMIEGCTRHENKSNFVSDNTMRNVESWMRFLQPTTP